MKLTWCKIYRDMVKGLERNGLDVVIHGNLRCNGLEHLKVYDAVTDNPADLCIYNHAMSSDLVGNVLEAKRNWFWKPAGPTDKHCALDTMGYGVAPAEEKPVEKMPAEQPLPEEPAADIGDRFVASIAVV